MSYSGQSFSLPGLQDEILLTTEVSESSLSIVAQFKGRTVGFLSGRFYENSIAHLEDIKVNEALPIERDWVDYLLRRTRTKSYRCRGIGSKLLTEFLNICRSRGMREAVGSVVQQDIDATPWLLAWYQKHGFAERSLSKDPEPVWFRPPNSVCEVCWWPETAEL